MENIASCNWNWNDLLADRDFIVIFQAKNECPLSFAALQVLGYLRRKKEAQTYKKIATATGLQRTRRKKEGQTVPDAVDELVKHELAEKQDGGWIAKPIAEKHAAWFAFKKDGKPKFWRLYKRAKDSDLTPTANALWCLCMNLDGQKLSDGSSRLKENKVTGFASMLGCDRKTITRTRKRLEGFGLLDKDAEGFALGTADDKHKGYWARKEDKMKGGKAGQDIIAGEPDGEKLARVFKIAEMTGFNGDDLDVYGARLVETWTSLRAAKLWQSDCRAFLKIVREECDDVWHLCTYLLTAFPANLERAKEYHARKGEGVRNILPLLSKIARDQGIPGTRPRAS